MNDGSGQCQRKGGGGGGGGSVAYIDIGGTKCVACVELLVLESGCARCLRAAAEPTAVTGAANMCTDNEHTFTVLYGKSLLLCVATQQTTCQ